MSGPPGPPLGLERTFLYCLSLLGLYCLLTGLRPTQVVLVSLPRPYYGRPSRPTTPRPRPMELNISMSGHRDLMKARVDRVNGVCSERGDSVKQSRREGRGLMWDTQHHLVYCPIYKVASGTWTTNFLRLSQFNRDLPQWQRFSKLYNASESVARKMFPPPKSKKEQKAELARSTKFLVVRHPFDRIVSAFKGKIAKPDAKPRFYRKLQKEIKKKYGENQEEIDKGVPPTFREYWLYLIDLTRDLVKPSDWRGVDCVQAYYSVCVPCDVSYDVVVKLETHAADSEFLIREVGLEELREPFTMWKHNGRGENQIGDYDYYLYDEPYRNPLRFSNEKSVKESSKEDTQDNIVSQLKEDEERKVDEKLEYKKSLFSQITRTEVKRLYENYKVDFDMFDYDIGEFLNYAQS